VFGATSSFTGVDIDTALEFATSQPRSVLITVRSNGRPQSSNVLHQVLDGQLRISITSTRAKYKNLVREPWAALHLTTPDFWGYAVIEGDVTLDPPAERPDDATVEALVDYYRAMRGEHENWDEYRAAMVEQHRLLARVTPTRAYGALAG
jgi:PPOX class probable F420-dependent enzyme